MRVFRWAAQLASVWETIRASYWFVPTVMAIASVIAAAAMLRIDATVDSDWVVRLPWIYTTTAEGGRSVLSVIAGSMITVTGVVFSITIVALTLASSQFGPRLLRNFMRDRASQAVMGTFVATFLFSLIVLRAIAPGEQPFIPYLSMAAAALLGVASLFVLIFFIHHAASSIQVAEVVQNVVREIDEILPELFPETLGEEAPISAQAAGTIETNYAAAWPVTAEREGYVRVVGADSLLRVARDCDLLVWIECPPGTFVSRPTVLARIWGCDPERAIETEIRDAFAIGLRRTPVQDLPFLTGQLTEMAVRALSPGTNDPQTAVACTERLGAVLETLASREFPGAHRRDESGIVRVVSPVFQFETLVAETLGPIRHYGGSDVDVVLALFRAVEVTIAASRPERRAFLEKFRREIFETAMTEISAATDRARIERQADA